MRLFILICSLLAVQPLAAQSFEVDYQEYDLENGLHVILHEDHSAPVVATTIMYHAGAKNEDPECTGAAHFVEHLMFEGSKNIDRGQFAQFAESAGGRLNANTSFDRTFYFELLPSNQLELGLWLESERLMHATLADGKKGLETQRDVVLEERNQRVDNQPYGDFMEQSMGRLYKDHPYQHPLIGYQDHIQNATKEQLNSFYKKYYVPNNAVLVVAGDIDPDSTRKLIEDYFGPIEKGDEVEQPDVDEPQMLEGEVRDTVYDKIQLPGVVQAYKTPAVGSEDYFAMDMLLRVLSRGQSSRMSRVVKEKKELAMQVFAFPFPLYDDPGMTLSFAIANTGVDVQELEEAMDKEVKKVRNKLITKKEFQKVRNQIESEKIRSNTSISSKARNLARYYLLRGDTDLINTELEKYRQVTRKDIKRVANKYLLPENRVVLYYLPEPQG